MTRTRGGSRTCVSRGAIVLLHVGLGLNASACALDFPKPSEIAEPLPAMEHGPRLAADDELGPTAGVEASPDGDQNDDDLADRPAVSRDAGAEPAAPARPPAASADPISPEPDAQPAAQPVDAGPKVDPSAPAPAAAAAPTPMEPVGETEDEAFVLTPIGFGKSNDGLTFPARSLPPYSESPAFSWRGTPEGTRSLALVLKEQALDVVNWVMWDISPSSTELPADIGPRSNPPEVPGSSQLGSITRGYSGPLLVGGRYEFTLWALDVEMLPNTFGRSVNGIVGDLLPMHVIDTTEPVVVTYAP
jgi:phosphatidylethanolamine-binding protein (PEBP) family uncharacterized protein